MFINYLKIALRNLKKHRGFSFINITGLAIGLTCCLFIALWVLDELSFDRFHANTDRIYKVCENQNYSEYVYKVEVTPSALAPALKQDFPDIEESARFTYLGTMLTRSAGEKVFYEQNIVAADPGFFRIFDFPHAAGDIKTALEDPNSIVITQDIANKYFDGENAVGKTLTFNNQYSFTVASVLENIPHNSHLQFEIVLPWNHMSTYYWYRPDNWGSNSFRTFVLLTENATEGEVNEKIKGLIKEHNERSVTDLYLMPLKDIHLYSSFYGRTGPGAILYVYIFSVIALFVLLIACINFMNLSTARSANRSREIGMRKVAGALRYHIIRQFLGESMLMAFIALLLAIIITALLLPGFNNMSGKELSFTNMAFPGILISGLFIATIFTGLIAGSYPALYLSSFNPIRILRGSIATGAKGAMFRKILVVLQFTLSISLIIGTWAVFSQLTYMQNKGLGWDKDHLIYIRMRGNTMESYDALKNELAANSSILNMTRSQYLPSSFQSNTSSFRWANKPDDQSLLVETNMADINFVETMNIEMVEGRGFSPDFVSDSTFSVIINETLREIMGVTQGVGSELYWGETKLNVVGVAKDFHFGSVRQEIMPLVMAYRPQSFQYMFIKVRPENISETVSFIESKWASVIPDYPIQYRFIDEEFDRMYRSEQRTGGLLTAFTVLAVFIASLGLFGLASFTAEQRTKEIGIRKVLGATVPNITILLCREFVKLIIIANIIAWPLAYYAMNNWLQGFAYRTELGITLFAGTGFLALAIAVLTVLYQAIKAAVTNPAEAIKYE